MGFTDYEEVQRNRRQKISKAKPPKKSKHKHVYEFCIIERPADWFKKPHERSGEIKAEIHTYCPICGKVGDVEDWDRWLKREPVDKFPYICSQSVPTEEYARELNPETRTLSTFWCEDIFPKFVTLPEVQE